MKHQKTPVGQVSAMEWIEDPRTGLLFQRNPPRFEHAYVVDYSDPDNRAYRGLDGAYATFSDLVAELRAQQHRNRFVEVSRASIRLTPDNLDRLESLERVGWSIELERIETRLYVAASEEVNEDVLMVSHLLLHVRGSLFMSGQWMEGPTEALWTKRWARIEVV